MINEIIESIQKLFTNTIQRKMYCHFNYGGYSRPISEKYIHEDMDTILEWIKAAVETAYLGDMDIAIEHMKTVLIQPDCFTDELLRHVFNISSGGILRFYESFLQKNVIELSYVTDDGKKSGKSITLLALSYSNENPLNPKEFNTEEEFHKFMARNKKIFIEHSDGIWYVNDTECSREKQSILYDAFNSN